MQGEPELEDGGEDEHQQPRHKGEVRHGRPLLEVT